jgi:3',5'-cyclic AMP phosphodiesterase CpdA
LELLTIPFFSLHPAFIIQTRPSKTFRIAVISDIHYAGVEERARCADFFVRIKHPVARIFARLFHHFLWLREIGGHNHMLDRFLADVGAADLVVANGDYSCNIAEVGLSDDAAFASAQECLAKLRVRFGDAFRATLGDHDLGKTGMYTGTGSMTLASWRSATEHLRIDPFWRVQFGQYVLLGITSSLVALPVFKKDLAAEDSEAWEHLRETHMEQIRGARHFVLPRPLRAAVFME